jgi:hypothetical protein
VATVVDDPTNDPIVNPDGTLSPPPAAAPRAMAPSQPAGQVRDDDDPRNDPIVAPSSSAPATTPQAARSWGDAGLDALGSLGHGAEVFASGFNAPLMSAIGAPVDLATAGINRLATALGRDPSQPLITDPVGGSAGLRRVFNQTQPDEGSEAQRLIYGAGSAAGTVPAAYLGGAALEAGGPAIAGFGRLIGRLPGVTSTAAGEAVSALPETLSPVTKAVTSLASPVSQLATAATGGAGSQGGRDLAAALKFGPAVQEGASLVGGLAAPGAASTAMAPATLLRPFLPGAAERAAGNVLATQPEGAVGDASQSIQRDLSTIGDPGRLTLGEISAQGAQQLEDTRAAQQAKMSGGFQAIPNDQTMVSTEGLQQRYADYASGLSTVRRSFLPDKYGDWLEGYGEQEPLSELQDFSSALRDEAQQARSGPTPDYNKANVLSGAHDAVFGQGAGAESLLAPEQGTVADDLRSAIKAAADYHSVYTNPKPISAVLRPGAPDSAALNTLLKSGTGQADRVTQFVNAAQGDPGTLQTARNWVVGNLLNGAVDAQGNLVGSKVSDFLGKKNEDLINSDVFTDDHRAAFNRIADTATALQQQRAAGIPTTVPSPYQRGTKDWQGAYGVSPAAYGALGAGIAGGLGQAGGHLFHLNPELLGLYLLGGGGAGHTVGPAILNRLYQGPQSRLADLLAGAATNPDLRTQLMNRAPLPAMSAGNRALTGAGYGAGGAMLGTVGP